MGNQARLRNQIEAMISATTELIAVSHNSEYTLSYGK
jgi:hypothetical protein